MHLLKFFLYIRPSTGSGRPSFIDKVGASTSPQRYIYTHICQKLNVLYYFKHNFADDARSIESRHLATILGQLCAIQEQNLQNIGQFKDNLSSCYILSTPNTTECHKPKESFLPAVFTQISITGLKVISTFLLSNINLA